MEKGSEKPILSIIVPIYNTALYLEQCLNSILEQTFTDWELILVDDGSTDGSSEICNHFEKKDRRIKTIHKQREGLVSARKTGLRKACGEYAAYVDSDDWIDRQMYGVMMDAIIKSQADIVLSGLIYELPRGGKKIRNGVPCGIYEGDDLKTQVICRMISMGEFYHTGVIPAVFVKVFRRELLLKAQEDVDDRITIGEDLACTCFCLLDAQKAVVIDECAYHYRYVRNSMSRAYDEQYEKKTGALYSCMERQFRIRGKEAEMEKQLSSHRLFLLESGVEALLSKRRILNIWKRKQEFIHLCSLPHFRKAYAETAAENLRMYGVRRAMHQSIRKRRWNRAFLLALCFKLKKYAEFQIK